MITALTKPNNLILPMCNIDYDHLYIFIIFILFIQSSINHVSLLHFVIISRDCQYMCCTHTYPLTYSICYWEYVFVLFKSHCCW
jgi:hypothetical protein